MRGIWDYIEAKQYTNFFYFSLANAKGFFSALTSSIKDHNKRFLKSVSFWSIILSFICGIVIGFLFNLWAWIPIGAILSYTVYCCIYVNFFRPKQLFDTETKVQRSEATPFGDAHWIKLSEYHLVKTAKSIYDIGDNMVLGRLETGELVCRDPKLKIGNANAVISGSSGGKKGTAYGIPILLQCIMHHKSAIITSAKGDEYAETHRIAEKFGAEVRLIVTSSNQLIYSDGVNLLRYVNTPNMVIMTSKCILNNTPKNETMMKPDYWSMGEESLFAAVLGFFCINNNCGFKATLPEVRGFMAKGPDHIEDTLIAMMPEDHPFYESFSIWKHGDSIPKRQVVQGIGYRLDFMSAKEIKDILNHDDVDLRAPAEKFCIYYVVTGIEKTYQPVTSVLLTLLYNEILSVALKNPDESLDNNVAFIIDEALAVGSIPEYAEKIATSRSFGIELTTIVQDLSDLEVLYPSTHKNVLNNAGIKVLLRTGNEDTAEYFQNLCGTYTGYASTVDRDGEHSGAREQKYSLADKSYLLNMPEDEAVVVIDGVKPKLKVKKQEYYKNYPGSRIEFYNRRDGATYHAHPMLEYYEQDTIMNHVPLYRQIENENKIGKSDKQIPQKREKQQSTAKTKKTKRVEYRKMA